MKKVIYNLEGQIFYCPVIIVAVIKNAVELLDVWCYHSHFCCTIVIWSSKCVRVTKP